MTREQVRAGRALLGWTQEELASRVDVVKRAIVSFENGASLPHERTLERIRDAFKAQGVEFSAREDGALVVTATRTAIERSRSRRAQARTIRGRS